MNVDKRCCYECHGNYNTVSSRRIAHIPKLLGCLHVICSQCLLGHVTIRDDLGKSSQDRQVTLVDDIERVSSPAKVNDSLTNEICASIECPRCKDCTILRLKRKLKHENKPVNVKSIVNKLITIDVRVDSGKNDVTSLGYFRELDQLKKAIQSQQKLSEQQLDLVENSSKNQLNAIDLWYLNAARNLNDIHKEMTCDVNLLKDFVKPLQDDITNYELLKYQIDATTIALQELFNLIPYQGDESILSHQISACLRDIERSCKLSAESSKEIEYDLKHMDLPWFNTEEADNLMSYLYMNDPWRSCRNLSIGIDDDDDVERDKMKHLIHSTKQEINSDIGSFISKESIDINANSVTASTMELPFDAQRISNVLQFSKLCKLFEFYLMVVLSATIAGCFQCADQSLSGSFLPLINSIGSLLLAIITVGDIIADLVMKPENHKISTKDATSIKMDADKPSDTDATMIENSSSEESFQKQDKERTTVETFDLSNMNPIETDNQLEKLGKTAEDETWMVKPLSPKRYRISSVSNQSTRSMNALPLSPTSVLVSRSLKHPEILQKMKDHISPGDLETKIQQHEHIERQPVPVIATSDPSQQEAMESHQGICQSPSHHEDLTDSPYHQNHDSKPLIRLDESISSYDHEDVNHNPVQVSDASKYNKTSDLELELSNEEEFVSSNITVDNMNSEDMDSMIPINISTLDMSRELLDIKNEILQDQYDIEQICSGGLNAKSDNVLTSEYTDNLAPVDLFAAESDDPLDASTDHGSQCTYAQTYLNNIYRSGRLETTFFDHYDSEISDTDDQNVPDDGEEDGQYASRSRQFDLTENVVDQSQDEDVRLCNIFTESDDEKYYYRDEVLSMIPPIKPLDDSDVAKVSLDQNASIVNDEETNKSQNLFPQTPISHSKASFLSTLHHTLTPAPAPILPRRQGNAGNVNSSGKKGLYASMRVNARIHENYMSPTLISPATTTSISTTPQSISSKSLKSPKISQGLSDRPSNLSKFMAQNSIGSIFRCIPMSIFELIVCDKISPCI